ncbi:uncharacterized protein RAG0_02439 [Rhynchosporium agropyri]|uniref:Peptidase A1 domain-containing protein n=1 Tax=Rhynchosporium agropyri TaxID=914238 RepID=A0A1E1K1A3_9HELO|nr:uncharacterized protein RAG0_02439 [Rhynchosporium agropyri]
MKGITAILLVSPLALATGSSAKSSPTSNSLSLPHFVELPISRSMNQFVTEVGIGDPPQSIRMAIDTGSGFTWVKLTDTQECWQCVEGETVGFCAKGEEMIHMFNANASSSYKPDAKKPFTAYRDKDFLQGYQSSESLNLNGATISKLQISMVQNSTMDVDGFLGLGYPDQSLGKGKKKGAKKDTLLDKMVKEGLIHHKAYSFYLNDDDAATGNILLGGMDTDKFTGSMKEMPIIPHKDFRGHTSYQAPQVMMTSLELDGKRSISFYNAAILDLSTRISYLPQDVFEPILEIIQRSGSNGTHLPISGSKEEGKIVKFVDCKLRNTLSDRTITLGFGGTEGAKIEVPIQDLIRPAPGCNEETIESMQDENGPPLLDSHCPCYLAIDQSPKSHSNDKTEIMVLGDALLRHAYVVYDLQNNVIGMAQRNFNSNTSNIVEFGKR